MAEFMNDDDDPFGLRNGPGVGTQIGPKVETAGDSGYDAFGKPVPVHRRSAALRHMREIGVKDTERATLAIDAACQQIERDQPYEVQRVLMQILDLTGYYRLLAVLLCHEDAEPAPAAPATFADFYEARS